MTKDTFKAFVKFNKTDWTQINNTDQLIIG